MDRGESKVQGLKSKVDDRALVKKKDIGHLDVGHWTFDIGLETLTNLKPET